MKFFSTDLILDSRLLKLYFPATLDPYMFESLYVCLRVVCTAAYIKLIRLFSKENKSVIHLHGM